MKLFMKVFAAGCLTGLFTLTVFSQELVKKESHDNGQVKMTIVQDGERFIMTEYYKNGVRKGMSEFLGSTRDGEFKSWHQNGEIQLVAEYKNGTPSGIWSTYDETGKKLGNATFQDGQLVSGSLWNESGQVIAYR